jgi:DNA-binding HxlR family transcriptional regulator
LDLEEAFPDEHGQPIFPILMVKGCHEEGGKRIRYQELKRALKAFKEGMSDSTLSHRLAMLVRARVQ